jgi:hypothetical protein
MRGQAFTTIASKGRGVGVVVDTPMMIHDDEQKKVDDLNLKEGGGGLGAWFRAFF